MTNNDLQNLFGLRPSMVANIISLRDENFVQKCSDLYQTLDSTGRFADVTLVLNDSEKVQAHSLVLSSCSQVFKSIIQNHVETNKELIISLDFSYPIIEKFLELIYLGEARASTSDKKDLVELIENLHIDLNDIRTEIKEEEEDVPDVEIEKKLETNENLDDNNRNCDQSELKEAKLTRSIHKPKQEIHEIKHENKKNQTENILNKRQFPCDECSYVATRKPALTRHVLNMHGDENRFSCQECNYVAIGKLRLRQHIKDTHYSVNYPCKKCTFQTTTLKLFNAHVQKVHLQQ